MPADKQDRHDNTFWIGLMTGAVVGAGLTMWLRPRATEELRQRVAESARRLSTTASNRYQQASTRVDETVDELTKKGQSLRNDVARTIVRGAHEAERIAAAIEADGPSIPLQN